MTGIEIKQARWRLNLSQIELAKKAGVDRRLIIDAEKNRNITERTMYRIETTLTELSGTDPGK
jgi:transcriptional regulator with XRE-family HTH domain